MKKLYKEAMNQLKYKKEDVFNNYIGKSIDYILDNSTNQREDMMNLNNLPKNYFIENDIVYKRDL